MVKENIIRYFQPFDHKEPFYAYFYYLPVFPLGHKKLPVLSEKTYPWQKSVFRKLAAWKFGINKKQPEDL